MEIAELNALGGDAFGEVMSKVCGSTEWISRMVEGRPYSSKAELESVAMASWRGLDESAWRDAFEHHPKIGDTESLRKRFASTAHLAEKEQAGVGSADETTIEQLRDYNAKYEERFGFIFIVCATGLGADEMLERLRARSKNSREEELKNAVEENASIIRLRLEGI